jgi:hypothetical protein
LTRRDAPRTPLAEIARPTANHSTHSIDSEDPDINRRFAHQGKIATPGAKAHNPSNIDNNLGANLIRIATDASLDAQDGAFERMAYMNGLAFLLKGVPSDLDTYEAKQIRSALPISLTSVDVAAVRSDAVPSAPTSDSPPSFIHRLTQMTVVSLVPFIHFILSKLWRG